MQSLRISIDLGESYDSILINCLDSFLEKLKQDKRVASKYKLMNIQEFKSWINEGLTPKQFEKIKSINEE